MIAVFWCMAMEILTYHNDQPRPRRGHLTSYVQIKCNLISTSQNTRQQQISCQTRTEQKCNGNGVQHSGNDVPTPSDNFFNKFNLHPRKGKKSLPPFILLSITLRERACARWALCSLRLCRRQLLSCLVVKQTSPAEDGARTPRRGRMAAGRFPMAANEGRKERFSEDGERESWTWTVAERPKKAASAVRPHA